MKPKPKDEQAALDVAVRLLARREHSELELRQKLQIRGYTPEISDHVIQQCHLKQWLSEQRFVDSFIRERTARDVGPIKILAELRARGIGGAMLETIETDAPHWLEHIRALWLRRYEHKPVNDNKEYARRWRFFQSRGFTSKQINSVLDRQR